VFRMSRKRRSEEEASEAQESKGAEDIPEDSEGDAQAAQSEEQAGPPGDEAACIESRIAELERELEAERSQALRVLADFQNFRRRTEEQRLETASRAVDGFISELLPVLDNFERALGAASDSQSHEALVAGVELILRQLRELLQRHGVEPIEAVGREFDPTVHEAVMRVPVEDAAENTVIEEVQRGYRRGSRVLRPAMVKVAVRP